MPVPGTGDNFSSDEGGGEGGGGKSDGIGGGVKALAGEFCASLAAGPCANFTAGPLGGPHLEPPERCLGVDPGSAGPSKGSAGAVS